MAAVWYTPSAKGTYHEQVLIVDAEQLAILRQRQLSTAQERNTQLTKGKYHTA